MQDPLLNILVHHFLKIGNYGKISFREKEDFEKVMQQIENEANRRLEETGDLVMTKVVGGFIATK